MVQAYCVKDHKLVDIKDPQQINLKNGRKALQGTCPTCGTKVTRIGSSAMPMFGAGFGDSLSTRPPGTGVQVASTECYVCPNHPESKYYPQQAGEMIPKCDCGKKRVRCT